MKSCACTITLLFIMIMLLSACNNQVEVVNDNNIIDEVEETDIINIEEKAISIKKEIESIQLNSSSDKASLSYMRRNKQVDKGEAQTGIDEIYFDNKTFVEVEQYTYEPFPLLLVNGTLTGGYTIEKIDNEYYIDVYLLPEFYDIHITEELNDIIIHVDEGSLTLKTKQDKRGYEKVDINVYSCLIEKDGIRLIGINFLEEIFGLDIAIFYNLLHIAEPLIAIDAEKDMTVMTQNEALQYLKEYLASGIEMFVADLHESELFNEIYVERVHSLINDLVFDTEFSRYYKFGDFFVDKQDQQVYAYGNNSLKVFNVTEKNLAFEYFVMVGD